MPLLARLSRLPSSRGNLSSSSSSCCPPAPGWVGLGLGPGSRLLPASRSTADLVIVSAAVFTSQCVVLLGLGVEAGLQPVGPGPPGEGPRLPQ